MTRSRRNCGFSSSMHNEYIKIIQSDRRRIIYERVFAICKLLNVIALNKIRSVVASRRSKVKTNFWRKQKVPQDQETIGIEMLNNNIAVAQQFTPSTRRQDLDPPSNQISGDFNTRMLMTRFATYLCPRFTKLLFTMNSINQ